MRIKSKEHLNEVIRDNNKVVVDFYADWCGPCKVLGSMLSEYNGSTVVAKVDCDSLGELASEYGVRSIPYVVKFEGGKQVDQFVGVPDRTRLEEFLG